jgi:hypothetical protein
MSSMKPRDFANEELISSYEIFKWQVDGSVTERRRRLERRNRIGFTIIAVMLALLVLREASGSFRFFSALTSTGLWRLR